MTGNVPKQQRDKGNFMNIDATASFIRQLFFFYLAFDSIVIAMLLYQQSASKATRDWSSVTGRVLTSKVVPKSSSNRSTTPAVTYTYEVAGKIYKGETILPGWIQRSSPEYARKIVARYPKGANVTVYYNPKKPSEACLERYSMAKAQEWKWLIGGVLMLPLVAFLVYFFAHSWGM
jgi:hypothetical protein